MIDIRQELLIKAKKEVKESYIKLMNGEVSYDEYETSLNRFKELNFSFMADKLDSWIEAGIITE